MPGTLDLLILKALALRPMHGWGITSRIQEMSHDTFQIGQGSLYPALQRCERRGWVASYLRGAGKKSPGGEYDLPAAGEPGHRGRKGPRGPLRRGGGAGVGGGGGASP